MRVDYVTFWLPFLECFKRISYSLGGKQIKDHLGKAGNYTEHEASANQGNNPDASATVHLKRRRGRPRKYPKMEVDHEANAHVSGIQNLNHGENAHAPPGFGVVNSNEPHQVGPVNNAIDAMIFAEWCHRSNI